MIKKIFTFVLNKLFPEPFVDNASYEDKLKMETPVEFKEKDPTPTRRN